MDLSFSFPENLFDASNSIIGKLKFDLVKIRLNLKQEKSHITELGITDSARMEVLRRKARDLKKQIEGLKQRIDLYWEYTLLRSYNPAALWFNNKTFSTDLSGHLGISRRDINKRKARIIRAGWATIKGDRIFWTSKDDVWRSFGVLIAKREYDENGNRKTHQKLGVYEVIGEKKVKKRKGEINPKTNKPYKKDIIYTFEKKIDVKVIKFKIGIKNLNKIELKRQAALAIYKHQIDRQLSRTNEDELRKTNEAPVEVDISCQYIAQKVGYISAGSGWHLRNELSDCGFISVCPKKFKVAENISYEDAQDKFELQKGVQEETGLAYYYDKLTMTVWGVNCYGIQVNGYEGINYQANKVQKPKKEPKRWIPFNLQILASCNGMKVLKIWQQYEFLFEEEEISDYLRDTLGFDQTFNYELFLSRYSKSPRGAHPQLQKADGFSN